MKSVTDKADNDRLMTGEGANSTIEHFYWKNYVVLVFTWCILEIYIMMHKALYVGIWPHNDSGAKILQWFTGNIFAQN